MQYINLSLIIYSVVHLCLILVVGTRYKKYSPDKLAISMLGTYGSPLRRIYNLSTVFYGFLIIAFGFSLQGIARLTSDLFILTGTAFAFTSFFPYDKFPGRHNLIAGFLAFFGVYAELAVFLELEKYLQASKVLSGLALITIVAVQVLTINFFSKTDRGYPKYTWYWEWIAYISEILFITLLSIDLAL